MANRGSWERLEFDMGDGAISYLKWERAGRDAPWVHFAHANGFNAQTYTRMLEPLADRLNIVAWDARGQGQSTLPADPAEMRRRGWEIYVEDLSRFLASFDRPMALAGHSLGSVVSLLLTAREPGVASSLLLVDPVILHPATTVAWGLAKFLGRNEGFSLVTRAARRRAQFSSREEIVASYRGRGGFSTWECGGCLEQYVEGGTRVLDDGSVRLSCEPLWESATFAQMSEWGWSSLRRVKVPVTIVYGEKSDTFLGSTARATELLMSHVKLVPVPGATHFVPMEFPERVGTELLLFGLEGHKA